MSHMSYVWDRTPVHLSVWLSSESIWTFWRKKRSLVPTRIQTLNLPAHSPYAILTMLIRLAMLCVFYIINNCPNSDKIYFCCVFLTPSSQFAVRADYLWTCEWEDKCCPSWLTFICATKTIL